MLLCKIENYGFLRESQTFVGVLISILTLCILMESKDNSNIIKRLIEYATNRRIKKIDSLIKFHSEPQDVSTKEKDNTRREAYKDRGCLSSFLRYAEKSDKLLAEKKFVEEGVYLQSMATVEQLCVITIDESDKQRVNQLTGNLSKRYLPAMASFYSLLYGLIIFLCDEIAILWGACTKDFIVSFTVGITSLSLAFWLVLWISFLFTNRLNGYSGEEEKGDSYLRRFTVLVDPEKFWRFILTIMLLFACSLCISAFAPTPAGQRTIIYVIGVLLPVLVLCINMLHNAKGVYGRSYETVAMHLLGFSILCFLWTAIIFICDYVRPEIWQIKIGYTLNEEKILRFATEVFILLNGLVLPYAVPVYAVRRIGTDINSIASRKIKGVLKKHKLLNKEIHKYVKKIPSEDLRMAFNQ